MLILLQNVSSYILFSVFSSLADVKFLERKYVIDEYTWLYEMSIFSSWQNVSQGNERQEGNLCHLITCLGSLLVNLELTRGLKRDSFTWFCHAFANRFRTSTGTLCTIPLLCRYVFNQHPLCTKSYELIP